jgi:hypothetical protein
MTQKELQATIDGLFTVSLGFTMAACMLAYYDLGYEDGEKDACRVMDKALDNGDFVIGPFFERNNPGIKQETVLCLKKAKERAELKACMLDKNVTAEECMQQVRVLMDTDNAIDLIREKLKTEKAAKVTEDTETTENKEEN